MIWNPGLTQLRDVLAELYPSIEDSRSVVLDAELTPYHIAFSSKAITNWQMILEEAHKQDKVEALALVAIKHYPQNKTLLDALETYREWVVQNPPSPTRLIALLRTKVFLVTGVSTLLVAGLIFFMVVIKPTPTPTPTPTSTPTRTVSEDNARQVFELDETWRPLKYIENDFEDRGKTAIDHATELMWQKSGSVEVLKYEQAQVYIEKLNRKRFAGHDDWRLPTTEELISLLEPERQENRAYINPIFNEHQRFCWSSFKRSYSSVWLVYFFHGDVRWAELDDYYYVRAVRAWP